MIIPVYDTFSGIGSGTCYITLQLAAGTTKEAVSSTSNSTAWVHVNEIEFNNRSTADWTTVTWNFTVRPNGIVNFHI